MVREERSGRLERETQPKARDAHEREGTMDGFDMMGDDWSGEDWSGDDWSGDDWSGDDALGDMLGDDVLGEEILGAVYRRAQQARRGNRGGQGRRRSGGNRAALMRVAQQRRAAANRQAMQRGSAGPSGMGRPLAGPTPWRDAQLAAGVQAPTEQMLIVGFTPEDGIPTFLPAGVTSKSFLCKPQKPFRGERLIITLLRSAGASTVPVNVTQLLVGSDNQIVGFGQIPAETFSGNFFGVRLAMTASQPGVELRVVFTLGAAVPAGESIGVQVTQIGRAII